MGVVTGAMVAAFAGKLAAAYVQNVVKTGLGEDSGKGAVLQKGVELLGDATGKLLPQMDNEKKALAKALEAALGAAIDHETWEEACLLELEEQLPELLQRTRIDPILYEEQVRLGRYLCQQYRNRYPKAEYTGQAEAVLVRLVPALCDSYHRRGTYLAETVGRVYNIVYNNAEVLAELDARTLDQWRLLQEILRQQQTPRMPAEVDNMYDEYLEDWKKPLFLNDLQKDDESKDQLPVIRTCELYEMLYYVRRGENVPQDDLANFLEELPQMLLVLGQPGVGKSTLISWLLNSFPQRRTLVYCFRTFSKKLWQEEFGRGNCANRLFNAIGENKESLRDTILILDGFDEIGLDSVRRATFLKFLALDTKRIPGLSIFVTCRENYMEKRHLDDWENTLRKEKDGGGEKYKYACITLLPWKKPQIEMYVKNYYQCAGQKTNDERLNALRKLSQKAEEVLGVPLLLYMITALETELPLEGEESLVAVYDRIFTVEEGGIYDRCVSGVKYDLLKENHVLVSHLKEQVHEASREIARWMFAHDAQEIPQEEYQKILERVRKNTEEKNSDMTICAEELKDAVEIGTFFKKVHHTEGTATICFVHRTMIQYFVVESFCAAIEKYTQPTEENSKALAIQIVEHFCESVFDDTVKSYLEQKLRRLYTGVYRKSQLKGQGVENQSVWLLWEMQLGG